MKKFIYSILLLLFTLYYAKAQDTEPTSPTLITSNFTWFKSTDTADTHLSVKSGSNWWNFAREPWVNKYFIRVSDSVTKYITPNYFKTHSSSTAHTDSLFALAEKLSNKSSSPSASTTFFPSWLGVENYAYPLTGNPSGFITTINGIAAGGDLSGTYPNPTINTINGVTKGYYDFTSSGQTQLNTKQPMLISGTNIKTINGSSLLGGGNLVISSGGGTYTASGPLSISGNNIIIQNSSTSQTGALTSTDWNTFNSKQSALALTAQQLAFGAASGGIQQDVTLVFNPATHTLSNGVVSQTLSATTFVVLGDSVPTGTGATTPGTNAPNTAYGWVTLLANRTGFTQNNLAVPGSEVTNAPYTIPVKTSAMKYLIFSYGINDFREPTIDSVQFKTNYNAAITNALSKGWTGGSQFIFVSIPASVSEVNNPTPYAKLLSFDKVIKYEATTTSGAYADVTTAMLLPIYGGQSNITYDNTHPNNLGHMIESYVIGAAMAPAYNITNQPLVMNGTSEFNKVVLNSSDLLSSNYKLLAIDDSGHIARTLALPSYIKTAGPIIFDGNEVDIGAIYPASYNSQLDKILATGTKFHKYYTYNDGVTLDLCDSQGNIDFYNLDPSGNMAVGGVSVGKFNVYVSNGVVGASNLGFYIDKMGNAYANGNFIVGTNGYFGGAYNSNDYGRIFPYTTSGSQVFNLNHAGGKFIFNWGPGDGTLTEISSLSPNGFELPRLSTTSRDALANVASASVAAPGSGYTFANIAISGGGAIRNATATVSIVSGHLGAVTITDHGAGYINPSGVTVTVTGDGTGGTVLLGFSTTIPTEGMSLENLTSHTLQFFNNSAWADVIDNMATQTMSNKTFSDKLRIATGTNASVGSAVLVGGTVTVNTTATAPGSIIYLTRSTSGGTPGTLSYTISAGSSFTINSSSSADTSIIGYLIIN